MSASHGFETPRRKIPIPLRSSRSQTQPISSYQTPITSPGVVTPLSTKSEPNTSIKNVPTIHPNNVEVKFALDLVEVIIMSMKQLNLKISKRILNHLNDRKQHKIIIESILMAPIICHLIKSCIYAKTPHQREQNYHQLLSFFIDYFQQIYPQLIWPKPQQIMQINDIKRISNKGALQTQTKNKTHIEKEKKAVSVSANHRKSVEISNNHNTFKKTKLPPKKILNDKNDERKFDEFIKKVNEIGNKFDVLQTCTNNNKTEICDKIKDIQHRQQELNKKLNNETTNTIYHNNIIKEWEKSHHHLGKKQQENIDLLQHQTQKFENIALRIKNALKQTDDPKIFESRFNFITQQTKDLEKKLDDVQQSVANKAKHLEESVKVAIHKYKEMENVTDLISIGVSPHNLIAIDKDKKQKENQNVDHECNTITEHEKKLSFLNNISLSETGFNYDKKRLEIRDIMNDVLDCKYRIDRYDTNNIKPFKMKINEFGSNKKYDDIEIEDDNQFKDRIKKRIERTMATLQNGPKYPPSLNVHWRKDTNEMRYIKDNELNKLKPSVARKYRKNYKCNKKTDRDYSVSSLHLEPVFECNVNKPSMDNIIKNAKQNVQSQKTGIKSLIDLSNQMFKQPASPKCRKVKVVRRTTKKPPELQFSSKPKPPPMPILNKRKRNIDKKKKLKAKSKKQSKPKHIHVIQPILVHNSLVSQSIQTMDVIQNSIEEDIHSMASCKEEQDTVSIITHSQNNLNSFCDDILNNLFNENDNSVEQSPSKTLQILQSIATQNAEHIECDDQLKLRDTIISSIVNDIITKSMIMSESKSQLSVEEMINQQNIAQETHQTNRKDNVEISEELEEEIQTIVHISSTRPKLPQTNMVEIKFPKIIHSPICNQYQQKLIDLQHEIKAFECIDKVKSYPVSSTSTSISHSVSASAVSSVPTSMVSSLDASETKRFWGNINVTDSIQTGISISASDSFVESSSDSDESEEFDNLKESLNRQWNEIQLALNNLTV